MTPRVDFYFSFRSPYSYLALVQVAALTARHDVAFDMRVVRPIAVRMPGFFKTVNPLWPRYLMRDTFRLAERLEIPYAWPRPDPVVMDIRSGEVPEAQPYIHRISRLGAAAAEAGVGLDFIAAAAEVIWSGRVEGWNEGDHLAVAGAKAGVDFGALEARVDAAPDSLDGLIAANEAAQLRAGHWGVPLFVVEDEPFFGQDRLDDLVWRLRQRGLAERSA